MARLTGWLIAHTAYIVCKHEIGQDLPSGVEVLVLILVFHDERPLLFNRSIVCCT